MNSEEKLEKKIVLLVTLELQAMIFYKGYVRFLTDQGWDVMIVAKSDGHLDTWASSEGGTGICLDFARNPSPWHDLKSLVRLTKLLREINPHVVVSATPKAGLLGMLSSKLLRVPIRIYQLWGLRLETEAGIKRKILWFFEKLAIWSSTQTLANSKSLAKVTVELELGPMDKVNVIGEGSSHGVDTTRFSPNAIAQLDNDTREFLASNKSDLTVVYVGRLARDKGIDTLLEALQLATQGGTRIRAIFVGRKEDEKVISKLQEAPSWQSHVVEHVADVRAYIRAADVLCLPFLREGFPNVVLEAAAMETPAVVSNATGARDSVVDNVTGRIFPVGASYELARILEELSSDHKTLMTYGRNARLRVEEHFEQQRIWELQLENIMSYLERP